MRAAILLPLLVGLAAPLALAQPAPPPAQTPANGDQPAAKPAQPATPAPPAPVWQPRQTATVQVLDKVNGQSATLTIAVNSQQDFRNLTIAVRACFARPPDQPADSTALLTITGKGAPTPSYTGWMLAAEPAAAMMQDPVYDVRVLGCM